MIHVSPLWKVTGRPDLIVDTFKAGTALLPYARSSRPDCDTFKAGTALLPYVCAFLHGLNILVHDLLQHGQRHGTASQKSVVELFYLKLFPKQVFGFLAQFQNFQLPNFVGARLTGRYKIALYF